MIPLNLIKTRTTRYTGEDGKERAVLFHEDYEQLIANAASADLFRAFQRFLDYEAYFLKVWFDECTKEGADGTSTQRRYQFGYNQLVCMRQRLVNPEYLLQFLDDKKFDMPEAIERIFPKGEGCK